MMYRRSQAAGKDNTHRSGNRYRLLFALALSLFVHGALACLGNAIFRRPSSSDRESRALTLRVRLAQSIQSVDALPGHVTSKSDQLPEIDPVVPNSPYATDDSIGLSSTTVDNERYYSSGEVDQKAEFIEGQTDLGIDGLMEHAAQDGTVLVLLLISPEGQVDKVIANIDTDFSRKAVDAIQGWRFRPAIKNGMNVPSSKLIELTLEPSFG